MLRLRWREQHLLSDLHSIQLFPHLVEEETILDQLLLQVTKVPSHPRPLLHDCQQVLKQSLENARTGEDESGLVGGFKELFEDLQG